MPEIITFQYSCTVYSSDKYSTKLLLFRIMLFKIKYYIFLNNYQC